MPIVLTNNDSYDASVSVPAGGDPRTAASVDGAFQALVNRTTNLRKGIPGVAASAAVIMPIALDATLSGQFGLSGAFVVQTSTASAGVVTYTLRRLPALGTITALEIWLSGQNPPAIAAAGAAHHAALPATKPTFALFKADLGTNPAAVQIGGTITDPSASVAAYETPHYISITGLSEVIDITKIYQVSFTGETGANAQNNDLTLAHIKVTIAP